MSQMCLHKEKRCSPILQGSCQHLRLRIYEYAPKCLKRPKLGRDDVTIEDVARYLEFSIVRTSLC